MAKKKKRSLLGQTEPPMRWGRAFWTGMFGSIVMMGWVDTMYMMGITPFSYEQYLGSLIRGTIYGHENWVAGFLANLLVGGLFGLVYAWAFEWVTRRSGARVGTKLGFAHAIIAAIAIFPFFQVCHAEMHTGAYPDFGFFGIGLGATTPIILLFGHLLFGMTVGLFYGPVRAWRVRALAYEPGELGMPGEADVVSEAEDAYDSHLVYRQGG